MIENLVRLSLYVWLIQVVMRKMKEEQVFGNLKTSQMMENLVILSLYIWLVQVVMRRMKEEQGEEDNQGFFLVI